MPLPMPRELPVTSATLPSRGSAIVRLLSSQHFRPEAVHKLLRRLQVESLRRANVQRREVQPSGQTPERLDRAAGLAVVAAHQQLWVLVDLLELAQTPGALGVHLGDFLRQSLV